METASFLLGMLWGVCLGHYIRKRPPKEPKEPAPPEPPRHISELARLGWAVVIKKTSQHEVNLEIIANAELPEVPTELTIVLIACSTLLGKLRDDHPDSDVCDKAVDLLVQLNISSHTL
jgi:hypothetical protein